MRDTQRQKVYATERAALPEMSADYFAPNWHAARAVWPVAVWRLEGLPGIGAHLARLAELRGEAAPLTLF